MYKCCFYSLSLLTVSIFLKIIREKTWIHPKHLTSGRIFLFRPFVFRAGQWFFCFMMRVVATVLVGFAVAVDGSSVGSKNPAGPIRVAIKAQSFANTLQTSLKRQERDLGLEEIQT